jgi:hypothetical protein
MSYDLTQQVFRRRVRKVLYDMGRNVGAGVSPRATGMPGEEIGTYQLPPQKSRKGRAECRLAGVRGAANQYRVDLVAPIIAAPTNRVGAALTLS